MRGQLERAAVGGVGWAARSRRRGAEQLAAPESAYDDAEGNVLVLRGAMTPATRARVRGGARRPAAASEDAWHRAVEFLFERLAVRWGSPARPIEGQTELLARYRFAGADERGVVRDALRDAPGRALPGPRGPVRIVDLSVPTGPGPGEPLPPSIQYEDHAASAPLLAQIFGCEPSDLPDGQGWASETVTLITHAGTHVDAPYHYFPTSGGERARTIDELPLDWFLRPGVRLDLRERPWASGSRSSTSRPRSPPRTTRSSPTTSSCCGRAPRQAWDTSEYFNAGSGLTRASTTWLLEQGVKVIGTDAWGLDRPLLALRAEFEKTGDASILWEAHRAGIDREYCQIEKLAQPRRAARAHGLHGLLPAGQGRRRLGRLVPRGGDPRMTPDPARFAALLAGYCLDVQPGQQVLVRSTTLAAPLLLALQREILDREAWPALRTSLPGQSEGYWEAARDVHLDAFAPPSSPTPRRAGLPADDPGAGEHERAGRRRPGAAGARRALAGGHPRARDAAPLVRDAVADAGGRAAGGDVDRRPSARSSSARCSSTATTRSPRGASCARARRG